MKVTFWISLKTGGRHTKHAIYPETVSEDELDEAMHEWCGEELPKLDAQGLVDEGMSAGVDIDRDSPNDEPIEKAA